MYTDKRADSSVSAFDMSAGQQMLDLSSSMFMFGASCFIFRILVMYKDWGVDTEWEWPLYLS